MTESSPTEQTNALLAAVVASSMDAVFSIDTNARIQTWNSAAEQLYGYTAAEAIGQPLGLLALDPTNYAPGTRFQRVLQGEQIYFETSRRRKDGSLVEVGISSGPIRDSSGHVVGVSVVHRDISERKRSERDLRQMHQWLEMAQEAGDVAPWAYDPKTGEVRWTKQLYRQLGYGSDEITPSLSAFRERVHLDDQMRLDDIREKERKAESGTQFQFELRLVRPNENSCWIDRRSRVVEHEGRRQIIGVNVVSPNAKSKKTICTSSWMNCLTARKIYFQSFKQCLRKRRGTAEVSRILRNAFSDAFELCVNRTIYSSVRTGLARRLWT